MDWLAYLLCKQLLEIKFSKFFITVEIVVFNMLNVLMMKEKLMYFIKNSSFGKKNLNFRLKLPEWLHNTFKNENFNFCSLNLPTQKPLLRSPLRHLITWKRILIKVKLIRAQENSSNFFRKYFFIENRKEKRMYFEMLIPMFIMFVDCRHCHCRVFKSIPETTIATNEEKNEMKMAALWQHEMAWKSRNIWLLTFWEREGMTSERKSQLDNGTRTNGTQENSHHINISVLILAEKFLSRLTGESGEMKKKIPHKMGISTMKISFF